MITRLPGTTPTLEARHDAHASVDKNKRYAQILEIMRDNPEVTAKECAVLMYAKGYIPTSERNFTAPRLTELSKMGKVEPIGKKRCKYTGKTVAVYGMVQP